MDPTIRLDQLPNHPPGNPGLPNAPAIRLEAITGRTTAHAGEATTTEVLLRIIGGGQPVSGARVPLNLCLVIDRSGSMDGQPLAAVRDACKHVVAQLGPTDILSIVTFEENVDIVLPAKHVTSPEIISAYIDRITAGNTTNLFDGLYAGGVQVTSVPLTGYASRLILLTDGEPTAGLKDPASILRQVEQLRAQGVVVSAMGFGPDYQEDLMASIARTGGGNYTYIAHAGQVAAAFQRELTGAMSVVATKAVLRFELPDNNQLTGDIDTMLPDIEAGTTIELLREPRADRGIPLPGGGFLPGLNGVVQSSPIDRPASKGVLPVVVAVVVDDSGLEWYRHADGSMTTSRYVFHEARKRWEAMTFHAIP